MTADEEDRRYRQFSFDDSPIRIDWGRWGEWFVVAADRVLSHRNAVLSVVTTADVPPAPPRKPLPTIGGAKMRWVCEFCFSMSAAETLPSSWELVLQSAVCRECRERVEADGGYAVVKCGAYADCPDPRA